MKNICSLLFYVAISTTVFAQNISTDETEQVKTLIVDCFDDIWSDFDATKISQHHTDDYLLLENGEVWNNDSVRNYVHKALARDSKTTRENRFEFLTFEKHGNSIWTAYHNFATWTKDDKQVGKAHWIESAVVLKTEEGWKIQMLHSTRIQEE